jgi:hypothetical protein
MCQLTPLFKPRSEKAILLRFSTRGLTHIGTGFGEGFTVASNLRAVNGKIEQVSREIEHGIVKAYVEKIRVASRAKGNQSK